MPLQGIKILDLSRLLPGPYCTLLLADLGAHVLKIEEPVEGDYYRKVTPLQKEDSIYFLCMNRNKESMKLNLKADEGREIFLKLVKEYDVIVEGFRPGVVDRLRIGFNDVKEINPRIVYCSISAYGQTGPLRSVVGHDANLLGRGGILDATGEPDGPPVIPIVPLADLWAGGMMAAFGIVVAVLARQRTGCGQYIDVSMFDGVISWLSIAAAKYFYDGEIPKRGALWVNGGFVGNNVYQTKDGRYMAMAILERRFWGNFCNAVGRKDLIDADFYGSNRGSGLYKEIQNIFLSRTKEEWVELLKHKECCVEPVSNLEEVIAEPHLIAREMLVEQVHSTEGKIRQFGIPIKFSMTPGKLRMPPPVFGGSTVKILRSLGYTDNKIEELENNGVI